MSDIKVRLNPYKILVQIGRDKAWKRSSSVDIIPKEDWLIPRTEMEGPDEEITVGFLTKRIDTNNNYVKDLWNDKGLKELHIKAKSTVVNVSF